jgi:hypothetical protein
MMEAICAFLTLSAINRHRQFALLHAAARARNIEVAQGSLGQSRAARTEQFVNRLSPMALIERRRTGEKIEPGS